MCHLGFLKLKGMRSQTQLMLFGLLAIEILLNSTIVISNSKPRVFIVIILLCAKETILKELEFICSVTEFKFNGKPWIAISVVTENTSKQQIKQWIPPGRAIRNSTQFMGHF